MTKPHTDHQYDSELAEIRDRLLCMAGRVEEMIGDSIQALVQGDLALAHKTREADARVDRDEVETDELCLVVLAKWQPMASDLRFVTLALKMVTDLERIGDLAVNICDQVSYLGSVPKLKPYVDIPRMGVIVQSMLRDAVEAFVARDAGKAREVIDRDEEVDALYHQILRDLSPVMVASEMNLERGIAVQSIAKLLERAGDHTTNLAEEVIYLVEGKDGRHSKQSLRH
jgi:phosphate transport system protein